MKSKEILVFLIVLIILSGCIREDGLPQEEELEVISDLPEAEPLDNVLDEIENVLEPRVDDELPSCGSNYTFFSVSPLALDDFHGLEPLGAVNPPGHTFPTDHIYFHTRYNIPGDYYSLKVEVPVLSPGDVWITSISSSENTHPDGTKNLDYSIDFTPCKEFRAYFIHVSSLSEKLESAFNEAYGECNEYETGGSNYKYCWKEVKIRVTAGEQIGTAGGPEQFSAALDLGAYDRRIEPLTYANPDRLEYREDLFYVVCPIDYFVPEIREAIYNRFSRSDGSILRTVEPRCGEVAQDIPGTAQGIWFVKGTGALQIEDPHLALIHDNVEVSRGIFSVGTSMSSSGLESASYYFDPNHNGQINRDFDEVTSDGNTYCYEVQKRFSDFTEIIILKLTSDTELSIEKLNQDSCGDGPWSFTSSVSEFER